MLAKQDISHEAESTPAYTQCWEETYSKAISCKLTNGLIHSSLVKVAVPIPYLQHPMSELESESSKLNAEPKPNRSSMRLILLCKAR